MAIQKGTGFTNLNRILQANKGNKLGSTVSGGIQGQVQGVKTQVKSAQDQFNEEAQKNRLDTQDSATKRDEILGRFAPSTGTANVGAQANQTGATNTAQQPANQSPVTDQEIQDFTKLRTGTYTGPKELQDVTSLYGKAQQAEQLGGLSQTEGGRQELLRRFVGGNNYTSGQKQLDSTLLGQKPGQLGTAAREARGATNLVEGANTQASNLAQEFTNKAKAFGEETTQKVAATKDPLSKALDTKVSAAQNRETTRVNQLKAVQDMLTNAGDSFKGLDNWTRTGLALQAAADSGMLSSGDLKMLLGDGDKVGLLQRGANLGLDMNALINERITNQIAQNTGRTGVAAEDEIAKLNALDRLAGKQGTDLEFLEGRGKYAAGKTGFNTGSLDEYISKSEAEKARSDKAYADKLAAEQARYMNQFQAGIQNQIGGAMAGVGTGLNQVLNPQSYYNPGEMAGNLSGQIDAATQYGTGLVQTYDNMGNAALEGLLKLNIGGQSIANTEGGRQLLKAIELKNKMVNTGLGVAGGAAGDISQGIRDLSSTGSWDDAFMNLSGINTMKDLGSQIMQGDIGNTVGNVGREVGNVAKNVGSAVKNVGKSVKKKLKKVFSDERLKENVNYDPKDVNKFMDRIKPAAYDYKDEVKDDPRASKNRELGVMAQDLEKTKLGKDSVKDTKDGKVVDYDNLEPKMLASIAALNKRLKELESKK